MDVPFWHPRGKLPNGYNTKQPKRSHNLTHVHHFYTKRNLIILSYMYAKIESLTMLFVFTGLLTRSSKQARFLSRNFFHGGGGWVGTSLSGTLFIPSLNIEVIPTFTLGNRIKTIIRVLKDYINSSIITTQSSNCYFNIPDNCIDYIFTDPPFGSNLNYSELNFIWESWLKVITNNKSEAIMNKIQGKGLVEYQELMTKCFEEYYRVLKPNRWMTVEFHNSKNSVWNAIQESLIRAGFIIADVRTLDKKQGSFKQVTTTSAVKQDLIISAYKPRESFKREMLEKAGSEETAWDFVREHLDKLPVVVEKEGKIERIVEREPYLLFDRMVAYHIMAGIAVPIDAAEFYEGLDERFLKRDGMYFLHDQINEYDNARIVSELEPVQFTMFVNDEKSAIAWLYHQLEEPQTYSEIQPKFMKEAKAARYEIIPELGELLEENFLQDGEGRWYIPDPSKSGDLIKLREKRLLKEFEEYLTGKGKLRQFRTEAIRVGFAKLWKEKDYENIVKVGNRLPKKVVQEDAKILMYYDIAFSRLE